MFERVRIGGVLYNACDELARQGENVEKAVIRDFMHPFMGGAAFDMRRLRVRANQAALASFIAAVNISHRNGVLREIFDKHYQSFRSIFLLYCFVYSLVLDQKSYFSLAFISIDDDVFREIQAY